jgi:hypothetical protein
MRKRVALMLAVCGITACGSEPIAPEAPSPRDLAPAQQRGHVEGTGLVLESITGITVPLLGVDLGDVVVRQAVIKEFGVIENALGQIVGVEVTGVLELTGGVLGMNVVTEDFTTGVGVISSSRGQCDVLNVNLAPISVDVLGRTAFVDLPVADVDARGNGAVGVLLCALGQALQPVVSGVTAGVRGLVNALNRLLI